MFRGNLREGQVLVKLFYSGICGKQIEEIDGLGGDDPYLPHMLGHEGTGIVIDTGPNVFKVKKNDTVVLHWMKGSGKQSETPIYENEGNRVNAGWVTTFNDHAVVSENRITKIPKTTDMKSGALFGCARTTGVGVIMNEVNLKSKHSIVVYGCGGVGLFVIQVAKLKNPKQIIGVDTNNKSLKLAMQFGASSIINAKECNAVNEIKKLTNGKGAERVVIVTGNKIAIENAINSSSIPSECYQVGVPVVGEKICIDAHALMHKRNLNGSLGGDIYPDRDIPKYMLLNEKGDINASKLITKIIPFQNINDGIDMMRGSVPGRVLIKF